MKSRIFDNKTMAMKRPAPQEIKPVFSIENLALLLLFSLTFLLFSSSIDTKSNDFWWHLAAGRTIVDQQTIPKMDVFSHTMYEKPWVNFEWLFQAMIYKIWKNGGFPQLILLKSLWLVLLSAILLKLFKLYSPHRFIHILFVGIWIYFLKYRDYFRPEIVTFLFFALTFFLLEKMRMENKSAYVPIAVLFVCWVNLHGGYIFGLILIGLFAAGSFLEEMNQMKRNVQKSQSPLSSASDQERELTSFPRKRESSSSQPQLLGNKYFSSFPLTLLYLKHGAIAFLCSFINPYGYKLLLFPFEHLVILKAHRGQPWEVREWQSTSFDGYSLFWGWLALVALVFIVSQIRKKKIDFVEGLLLIFFSYSAIQYVRNIHLFILLSLPITVKSLPALKNSLLPNVQRVVYGGILIVLALSNLYAYKNHFNPKIVGRDFPVRACEFIARNSLPGNGYNSYSWGGYFSWRLFPSYKNFMDSRYLFVDLLKEEHLARTSTGTWQGFLEKYHVAFALSGYPKDFSVATKKELEMETLVKPPRSELIPLFPPSKWALIFWDQTALIFVLRTPSNQKLIQRYEYTLFRPDDHRYIYFLMKQGIVPRQIILAEIERNIKENGKHPANQLFRDYFRG